MGESAGIQVLDIDGPKLAQPSRRHFRGALDVPPAVVGSAFIGVGILLVAADLAFLWGTRLHAVLCPELTLLTAMLSMSAGVNELIRGERPVARLLGEGVVLLPPACQMLAPRSRALARLPAADRTVKGEGVQRIFGIVSWWTPGVPTDRVSTLAIHTTDGRVLHLRMESVVSPQECLGFILRHLGKSCEHVTRPRYESELGTIVKKPPR
jgi:hypothetical protein